MGHRKAIIHCSCANALYPAQAIQWDKCNFTRFSTNFIFEDFSWIDSVGHRKRSGGPHAAHGPAVGPRFSIKLADRFLAYLLYRALTWSTFKLLTLFLFFLSTTWSWTLLSIPPPLYESIIPRRQSRSHDVIFTVGCVSTKHGCLATPEQSAPGCHFDFFEAKFWNFFFQAERLGSGKTLSELHVHYKSLLTRV